MRTNYASTSVTYGGYLVFPALPLAQYKLTQYTQTTIPSVTIPLFVTSVDEPTRQPKVTEIYTIPTMDFARWSDGTTAALFQGGFEPLQTSIDGYLLTPVVQVQDSLTGVKFGQVSPTSNGLSSGTNLGLNGFSYADVIQGYISGQFAQVGPSNYMRIDPSSYTDAYGKVYSNPVIVEFTSTKVAGSIWKETFTLKLYLET